VSHPPTSRDPTDTNDKTPTAPLATPLLIWLMVQLLALLLAAARVPLSANFVQPGEALAVHEMLVAQFAAAAMLFPILLRDARHCLAMMLTAAPMLQLAAVLAPTPTGRVIGAWTSVALWLAALCAWRAALAPRFHLVAVACANLITVGGLILWYLAREFAGGESPIARITPLVATLQFIAGTSSISLPLISTAILAVAGGIAFFIAYRRKSAR